MVQSLERLKLLTILTTADIRAVGPGVWNGWKAQLLRTLYYETEPVLTGGFSEVNRAQRVAMAQAELAAELKDWPAGASSTPISRGTIRPIGSRSTCRTRSRMRASCAPPRTPARSLATTFDFDADARRHRTDRAGARSSLAAVDHRRRLRRGRRQHRRCADLHDHRRARARHHRGLARIRSRRGRGAPRRPHRRHDREGAARRTASCRRWWQARAPPKGRIKAFAIEPEVTINNQWSNRYTVIEVTGLDRPGLLYELTATLSKLNLNIASAHVATFGERVVDVFYVTDLLGAKIASPTRQAAIKRALIALFAKPRARARRPGRQLHPIDIYTLFPDQGNRPRTLGVEVPRFFRPGRPVPMASMSAGVRRGRSHGRHQHSDVAAREHRDRRTGRHARRRLGAQRCSCWRAARAPARRPSRCSSCWPARRRAKAGSTSRCPRPRGAARRRALARLDASEGIEIFELVPPESLLDEQQQQSLLYSSDLELGETTQRIFEAVERLQAPARRDRQPVGNPPAGAELAALPPADPGAEALFRAARRDRADARRPDHREPSTRRVHSVAHGVIRLEELAPEYGAERRRAAGR